MTPDRNPEGPWPWWMVAAFLVGLIHHAITTKARDLLNITRSHR